MGSLSTVCTVEPSTMLSAIATGISTSVRVAESDIGNEPTRKGRRAKVNGTFAQGPVPGPAAARAPPIQPGTPPPVTSRDDERRATGRADASGPADAARSGAPP